MTKRVLACVALAIGCIAQIGLALPDLVVARLEISPVTPTDGALVTVTASIENVGLRTTDGPFFVRFAADGREIDLVPLTSLGSGRTEIVATTWVATAGPHVLSVEVDAPLDRVEEADEDNNTHSLAVTVRLTDEAMSVLAPLKIAVARFDDLSSAGFVNVGEGVADELVSRFASSGLRVIDRIELDALMQARGLNPSRPENVASTARLIGADLLVLGSVESIRVQQSSLSLGFLRVESAAVDVGLSAQVIDVHSAQPLSVVSAEGHHEGTTGFSIDVGELLSFLSLGSSEVCTGGLQADRAWYNSAQTVLFGYRNDGAPAWFGIEVYSSTGAFLKWLGWQFIDTGNCETWFWDQRSAAGFPVSPGVYSAKLWDGTSYIDTVGFQIRPGISLSAPAAAEITVGSTQFDDTVVGTAMNQSIDRMTSALLVSMADTAPEAEDRAIPLAAAAAEEGATGPREGQIAAILPDGRIAVNLGASAGVIVGDVFEVLEAENLTLDPLTSEVLDYDIVSVRGEIRVIEVRDRVSYAATTSGFAPSIGDVVRSVP